VVQLGQWPRECPRHTFEANLQIAEIKFGASLGALGFQQLPDDLRHRFEFHSRRFCRGCCSQRIDQGTASQERSGFSELACSHFEFFARRPQNLQGSTVSQKIPASKHQNIRLSAGKGEDGSFGSFTGSGVIAETLPTPLATPGIVEDQGVCQTTPAGRSVERDHTRSTLDPLGEGNPAHRALLEGKRPRMQGQSVRNLSGKTPRPAAKLLKVLVERGASWSE
jgi:hypothetical protein